MLDFPIEVHPPSFPVGDLLANLPSRSAFPAFSNRRSCLLSGGARAARRAFSQNNPTDSGVLPSLRTGNSRESDTGLISFWPQAHRRHKRYGRSGTELGLASPEET